MNFYQAQDQARKQSRLLVLLFAIAVIFLVLITNLCVAFFVLYSNPEYALNSHNPIHVSPVEFVPWVEGLIQALGWKKFVWTTLLVCGVIFMAMGFKWHSLSEGGRVVAESLGGRLLAPNTSQIAEKRLLNIVEEIALASGVPVPQVYLLEHEQGINAFAAGLSSEDAVIGVTQGSLNYFNRDQLQGVIAHEFSHILNGDMRLNMKLLAVLHGILMISEAGRGLMSMASYRRYGYRRSFSHSNRKGGAVAGFFVLGLCLWLIGLLGQLFGALIKSAVSRQREFLADASAVQFTRNPDGIADALSIIGGAAEQSRVTHRGAHEVAHLFFSSSSSLRKRYAQRMQASFALFATHPPLEERIKRISPKWRGRFIKAEPQQFSSGAGDDYLQEQSQGQSSVGAYAAAFSKTLGGGIETSNTEALKPSSLNGLDASIIDVSAEPNKSYQDATFELISQGDEVEKKTEPKQRHKEESWLVALKEKAHEPLDASHLMIALLLDKNELIQKKQLMILGSKQVKWVKPVTASYHQARQLKAPARLEIAELAVPSLKLLSLPQYKLVRELMSSMIHADGKVDVFEWLIFQLLKQYCDRHFGLLKPEKPKYKNIKQISKLYEIVLSRLVHYSTNEATLDDRLLKEMQLSFNRACNTAGTHTIKLLPLEKCQGALFTRAVHELSLAYPLLKPRLIKGLVQAARSNNVINDHERYVITGIAAVMDCPLMGLDA